MQRTKSPIKEEQILCLNPRCREIIAKQFRGKTTKRLEIQVWKKGKPGRTGLRFPKGYLWNGCLKIPIPLTCPVCNKESTLLFIIEDLRGITFSFKGNCWEVTEQQSKQISKKSDTKKYRIYLKLK